MRTRRCMTFFSYFKEFQRTSSRIRASNSKPGTSSVNGRVRGCMGGVDRRRRPTASALRTADVASRNLARVDVEVGVEPSAVRRLRSVIILALCPGDRAVVAQPREAGENYWDGG